MELFGMYDVIVVGGGIWGSSRYSLSNVENLLVAGKPISTERDPYHRFLQQTMVTG